MLAYMCGADHRSLPKSITILFIRKYVNIISFVRRIEYRLDRTYGIVHRRTEIRTTSATTATYVIIGAGRLACLRPSVYEHFMKYELLNDSMRARSYFAL